MEKIKKHKHTHFNLKGAFSFSEELVSDLIPIIKKKPKKTKELFEMAKECIEHGNMLGYPKETILPYMQLCMEAIVGYYRVCSNTGKEVSFTLDGETIKAVANETPNLHNPTLWLNGMFLSIIKRDYTICNELTKFPIEIYSSSNKVNTEYMQLYKHLYIKDKIRADEWLKVLNKLLLQDDEFNREYWDYTMIPKVDAIEQFITDNEKGFQEKLYIANQKHKEYWGSQAEEPPGSGFKRAQDNMGFISLSLTALAAMAHDRNWTIGFESDYMPTWMVRGEFDK